MGVPTIRRKIQFTIKDNQRNKKKIIKSKIKNPNWFKNIFMFSVPGGKKVKRICEPSKGGMGTKLNTAKSIFM